MVKSQQGGDFLSTVVDLAVPFGLILAARTLQNKMHKSSSSSSTKTKTKSSAKKTDKVKAVKSPKASVKTPKQKGGSAHADCLLCKETKKGGASSNDLVKEFRSLTQDIRGMLDRF